MIHEDHISREHSLSLDEARAVSIDLLSPRRHLKLANMLARLTALTERKNSNAG